MTGINRQRLSGLSVLALFTVSMSASLRAAIANSLKAEWIDPIAPIAASEMIGVALGSAGALASFFVLPRLGEMFEQAKVEIAGGSEAFTRLTGEALRTVEDAAASQSFAWLTFVPLILLVVFGGVWLAERRAGRRSAHMAEGAA